MSKYFMRAAAGWWLVFFFAGTAAASPELNTMVAGAKTFMLVIRDAGDSQDFVTYAEVLLKKGLSEEGAVIVNPDLMEKIKENKLLLRAIENATASVMAEIATDYGADVLIRGDLSVDARQKFAASWEGTAALSLRAINTATAEEIANISSDPFGSSLNPAPIEDSPLIAKQAAIKRVCNNVLQKMGIISDKTALQGATTIACELYDIFSSKSGTVVKIKISPSGRFLLTCGGAMVETWDLEKKTMIRDFRIKGGKATALAIASDSQAFAVGDHKGVIHFFNMDNQRERFQVKCHAKGVTDLAFNPDGSRLVSSGKDGTIQIVNTALGAKSAALTGHAGTVHSIAVTPDGRHIVSAGDDLTIRLWDVNVHKQKKSIQESADKLLKMVLSLDGSMVASSTVDVLIDLNRRTRKDVRHIKIRNTVTGEEIRTLAGHKQNVTALAFHPDKRFLASGAMDRSIRIWDLQMGDTVSVMEQSDAVNDVDFSNNGGWFASLTRNRQITVWKLQ